jgi:hypothetical protein
MNDLNTYGIEGVELGVDSTSGMLVRDLKVFRVGTFRNSRGKEKTWTADELQEAASNFRLLKEDGVFPNVPMRIDHTRSARDVCGYFADIRFDGIFLLADVLFTDADAYAKYQLGTFRSRSLEIGPYTDNRGTSYASVVQGLAWVDIPAVEGLYSRHADEGDDMTKPNGTPVEPTVDDETPEPDPQPEPEVEPEQPAAQVEPEPEKELVAQHAAPTSEVHTFRVGGEEVNDFAAVQAHIDGLEKFRQEAIDANRVGFLKDLADKRILTAPQVEQFTTMVRTMTDEQFDTFSAAYADAPANPLFGRHDFGVGSTPTAVLDAEANAIMIRDLEAVVDGHRKRNMKQEDIEQTDSWKKLQALKENK